eukprot:1517440-Ditylum_brightwellii.AAC.1
MTNAYNNCCFGPPYNLLLGREKSSYAMVTCNAEMQWYPAQGGCGWLTIMAFCGQEIFWCLGSCLAGSHIIETTGHQPKSCHISLQVPGLHAWPMLALHFLFFLLGMPSLLALLSSFLKSESSTVSQFATVYEDCPEAAIQGLAPANAFWEHLALAAPPNICLLALPSTVIAFVLSQHWPDNQMHESALKD